jgi:hypothetical protein
MQEVSGTKIEQFVVYGLTFVAAPVYNVPEFGPALTDHKRQSTNFFAVSPHSVNFANSIQEQAFYSIIIQ